MIFCNVGLLDEQIPAAVKEQHPGLTHTPAYYDDSGKIIAFDFGYDTFGVRYLNRLETEVRRTYEAQKGTCSFDSSVLPAIVRYIATKTDSAVEEVA